jgi:prepilin-type processing-associated H-X9-DG protein
MRKNIGFTLVELLIVVAMIMLMIALLLPVIMKARQKAHQITCMMNMQALGAMYHAYALDYNDGIVPMIRAHPTIPSIEWYSTLPAYGSYDIAFNSFGTSHDIWIRCPMFKPGYNSYAQNDAIGFNRFLGAVGNYPVKFCQIPAATRTVLMTEHWNLLHNDGIINNLGKDTGQPHYLVFPTPHFGVPGPHGWYIQGLANVLFCDGHAEPIHWQNNWLRWDNLHVKP